MVICFYRLRYYIPILVSKLLPFPGIAEWYYNGLPFVLNVNMLAFMHVANSTFILSYLKPELTALLTPVSSSTVIFVFDFLF